MGSELFKIPVDEIKPISNEYGSGLKRIIVSGSDEYLIETVDEEINKVRIQKNGQYLGEFIDQGGIIYNGRLIRLFAEPDTSAEERRSSLAKILLAPSKLEEPYRRL